MSEQTMVFIGRPVRCLLKQFGVTINYSANALLLCVFERTQIVHKIDAHDFVSMQAGTFRHAC